MYFRLVPDNRHHLTLPYHDLASIECISPLYFTSENWFRVRQRELMCG